MTAVTRSASPDAKVALLVSFALFMAALAVTTWHLGARSLIFDEATSISYARLSPSRLWELITAGDPNQGLYYVILSGWIRLAGESEAAVRLPSALAMSIAAPLVFLIGRRLFETAIGVWAGLFFLSNALIVRFAQTARAYGVLTVLTLLATVLLLDDLVAPSPRRRAAYVAVSVLAIHAHYFATLTLAAHAVMLATARVPWRRWLPVGIAIALLCLPEIWIAASVGPAAVIGWIPPLSRQAVQETLTELAGGSAQLIAVWIALAFLGGIAAARGGRRSDWQRATGLLPHAVLVTLLAVPIALAFAASFVQPMFIAYYLIACVPACCLLAASAWPALGRWSAPAVMCAVLALSTAQLGSYDAVAKAENWRDASRHILAARREGDAVFVVPFGARRPLNYYARQADVPETEAPTDATPTRRAWVLIRDADASAFRGEIEALHGRLGATHRLISQPPFRRLTVELWEP